MATPITRLTPFIRQRIINLHLNNINQTQIVKVLSSEDNIKVGRKTVNRLVNTYKKTGVLENRNNITRRRPKLNQDHLDYIDSIIQENGEITAVEIVKKLKSAYYHFQVHGVACQAKARMV